MLELKSPAHAGLFFACLSSDRQSVVVGPTGFLRSIAEQETGLCVMLDFEPRLQVSRLQ